MKPQQQTNSLALPTTYATSSAAELLHSVRKPSAKPWKKAITAPLLPAPTKIYWVEPGNFRDLVQKLTGAPKPTLLTRGFPLFAPQPVKVVGAVPMSGNDDDVPLPLLPHGMMTNQAPSAAKPLSFSYGSVGVLGFSSFEPTPLAWS